MSQPAHFSEETFRFLSELADNNDRDWFEAHRERYETHVKEPVLNFIRDFAPELRQINENFAAIPRIRGGSMFRIYRDMRFTQDDRPYKTWTAAHFRHVGHSEDVHGPGYYLHLEPGNVFMGAGIWHPDSSTLERIRQAIVNRPGRWITAIRSDEFTENFRLTGERLKLGPRGYDRDHQQIEHLKWKDFVCQKDLTDEQACQPEFLETYAQACRQAEPFMRFLTGAVGLNW